MRPEDSYFWAIIDFFADFFLGELFFETCFFAAFLGTAGFDSALKVRLNISQ